MISIELLVIVLCMVGQAFFAGMETGVISIHRMRLRHFVRKGSYGAKLLQGFLDAPDRLLGTTLVGTNMFMVVISVVAASMAQRLFGVWGQAGSTFIVTVLVLVFCEYCPKAWFRSKPLERCRSYAGVLRFSEIIFKPISVVIIWITSWMVPGPAKSFSKPAPFVTKEDLKLLANEGEENGILSSKERFMINSVFELSGKPASEIMIPRSEMSFVFSHMTMPEFLEVARKSEFTRFPVFDKKDRKFVGIINVFYVLSEQPERSDKKVSDYMRAPLFIPENMPSDEIFPRLRLSHQPMCLVFDWKSRVSGLITTEDVLEEIVGEL